jgi:hypothetical protein
VPSWRAAKHTLDCPVARFPGATLFPAPRAFTGTILKGTAEAKDVSDEALAKPAYASCFPFQTLRIVGSDAAFRSVRNGWTMGAARDYDSAPIGLQADVSSAISRAQPGRSGFLKPKCRLGESRNDLGASVEFPQERRVRSVSCGVRSKAFLEKRCSLEGIRCSGLTPTSEFTFAMA